MNMGSWEGEIVGKIEGFAMWVWRRMERMKCVEK